MLAVAVASLGSEPESQPAAGGAAFDRLAEARARLLEDAVLDPGLARLVAAALDAVLAKRERAAAIALRRAGRRERDALVRRVADEFHADLPSVRARAAAVREAAARYAAGGWRSHRGQVVCPRVILGTERELLWRAFKLCSKFPSSQRAIEIILATAQK